MYRFRFLNPDEIECRIGSVKAPNKEKNDPGGVSLLLYKTARTDANLLDETVGAENWQNDFKLIDGVLFGGLGVDYGSGCVWKWDAGTESNTEAEKGRASDAFKRAGYKHGIGRELYTSPFIWVSGDNCRIVDGRKCYDNFSVVDIRYDDKGNIIALEIRNDRLHKSVYFYGQTTSGKREKAKQGPEKEPEKAPTMKPIEAPDGNYYCQDCGMQIDPLDIDGKTWSPKSVALRSMKKYGGQQLCWNCQKNHEEQAS